MLTGGVIHAAELNSVPDGITVTPDPGVQESVPVITFCAKGAPGFSNLKIGSLSGNYITVTSPSGESRNVNLYGDAENTASGNFYAEPGFNETGEWTVTTHFPTVQYMDGNLNTVSLPESWQEFSFSYTVSQTSELPVFKIDGEQIAGTTYNIASGTIAEVTFEIPSPDVSVYYSWTPTSGTALQDVKYESPVEITGGGTFSYYAEQNGVRFAVGTLTVTEVKTLTMEDFTITPEPGKYTEWTADRIVIANKDQSFDFGNEPRGEYLMTITNPAGESQTFRAMRPSSKEKYAFYFALDGYISDTGTYDVAVNFDGYEFMSGASAAVIAPMTFSYEIDVETGIGKINADSEDAEYYDLTGRRVTGELSPGIYLVREQDKTYKRIIK